MDLQLRGRRAVVTGASGGLGSAIAHALAAEGVDLVLTARDRGRLEKVAAEVAEHTAVAAHVIPADVRRTESVHALVEQAVGLLGGIDILVNGASDQSVGAAMPGLAHTTDEVFWDDVDTKVVGYLRTARAVADVVTFLASPRSVSINGDAVAVGGGTRGVVHY